MKEYHKQLYIHKSDNLDQMKYTLKDTNYQNPHEKKYKF